MYAVEAPVLPVVPDCPVNLTEPEYALPFGEEVLTLPLLPLVRTPLAELLAVVEMPLLFVVADAPLTLVPDEVLDCATLEPPAAAPTPTAA